MSADLLVRSSVAEVVTDGRTLEGIAYRFDTPSWVSDGGPRYQEELARSTADGLGTAGLHYMHPFTPFPNMAPRDVEPFGAVTFQASDSENALVFSARVSETRKGDEYLSLINDGALSRNVSVGFVPIASEARGRVTVRTKVSIDELSLLPHGVPGAHVDAGITVVRSDLYLPNREYVRRKLALL